MTAPEVIVGKAVDEVLGGERLDAGANTKKTEDQDALAWQDQDDISPTWSHYTQVALRLAERFQKQYHLEYFDYWHPVRLQRGTVARLRKVYPVRVAYTDWGKRDAPVLICCGGVANTAMRFNYLAADLSSRFRVICMDWVGRGLSAWMAHERDYSLQTCVEQLRQMIAHVGARKVMLLGSSLGGSVAIEYAARYPGQVSRLVLNDIGPYIPRTRRKRRSETLARHYVFREPRDLLRKVGASQKNDGPVNPRVRLSLAFHQTRWSDEEGGRIFRHDVRAMQAYQRDAGESMEQWKQWERVRSPVLLIHGLLSDALLPATIKRMARNPSMAIIHVPDTGHTPVLSDRNQTWFIREWLSGGALIAGELSALHAPERQLRTGARTWCEQPLADLD